ncbi:MAG: NDP-sugar synthase [Candidatus Omnitrophica bacterium]|nr:NDP-sugar synthase [Candidatus Omnitrophota bacterium]
MKAVILAAGKGVRLGELVKDRPKPMLEVGGEPVLKYSIEALAAQGIREIYINLFYLGEVIRDYFGDGSGLGVKIEYSSEKTLLGTAGGVKKIAGGFKEPFIVLYGDSFRTVDHKKMEALHRKTASMATIAVYRTPTLERCGIVEFGDDMRITGFLEKPLNYAGKSGYANAGAYCLDPRALELIPDGVEYDFASQLFPCILSRGGKLSAFILEEPVYDIGVPEDLEKIRSMMGSVGKKGSLR